MSANINMGDIIFQLIAMGIPIIQFVIIFLIWRSSRKYKEQLNRIEKKLDSLEIKP